MGSPVRQFFVYVAVLLLPCFALWTLASATLALPAIGLVNLLLSNWLPDVIFGIAPISGEALLMTQFGELQGKAVPLADAEYRLAFRLDTPVRPSSRLSTSS